MNELEPREVRKRALAASLACLTETEVAELADVAMGTVEAWRSRGKGPDYIVIGNAFLYPRQAFADYLQTLVRERSSRAISAKGQL
jgi:hypothetical protein